MGAMPSDPVTAATIRDLLIRLNAAWTQLRFADLEPLLHPEAVFVHPGWSGRSEGREACVKSYREFMTKAKLTEFTTTDVMVDTWGTTAVAAYRFVIAWEEDGKPDRAQGQEAFVLARGPEGWRIVWRTLVLG